MRREGSKAALPVHNYTLVGWEKKRLAKTVGKLQNSWCVLVSSYRLYECSGLFGSWCDAREWCITLLVGIYWTLLVISWPRNSCTTCLLFFSVYYFWYSSIIFVYQISWTTVSDFTFNQWRVLFLNIKCHCRLLSFTWLLINFSSSSCFSLYSLLVLIALQGLAPLERLLYNRERLSFGMWGSVLIIENHYTFPPVFICFVFVRACVWGNWSTIYTTSFCLFI